MFIRVLLIRMVIVLMVFAPVSAAGMVKKIVLFEENTSAAEVSDYLSAWEGVGVITLKEVPFINGAVLSVPDTITSAELADDYRVMCVEDDQQVDLQAVVASGDGGAGDGGATDTSEPIQFITPVEGNPLLGNQIPWGIVHLYEEPYDPLSLTTQLKSSDTPELVAEARTYGKITEIRIAIFDTGVDFNHPKLGNLVKESVDFVNGTIGIPDDDNGHGTHVAATLVGYKLGVARGVQLYSAKILDKNATGDVSTLISAIQWAMERNINVINMSIAFRENNLAVHTAIRKAYDAGIIMIAATGNHSNWELDDGSSGDGGAGDGGAGDGGAGDGGAGDGGAGTSDASENPYPVMYPAAYPEVIAVGAHDSFGNQAIFSNTGPETDITGPGVNVLSANLTVISQYGVCSGTSMATPHVSGTAALMLALHTKRDLYPEEVRSVLKATAYEGKLNLVGALDEVNYMNKNL